MEGVALLVGLGRDVNAVLVAEVVPSWVVRIVARAHGVDVEALHYLDVLYHAVHGHHVASIRIHLVPVGTLYEHRLAVHEQLRVLYLHLSEAHLLRYHLHHVALAVFHHRLEGEEVRRLGRPLLHVAHHEAHGGLLASAEVGRLPCHDIAAGVEQSELHHGLPLYPCVYEQLAVLIVVFQVGRHADVLHLHFGVLGEEVALACHAGEAPEVLVLAHGAVAPAEGLEGDEVLAGVEILGDVKLRRHLRVLGVAHVLAVDEQVHV